VQLRYSYRVYPTPDQQQALARTFGCARVVFNDGLRLRRQAREAGEKYLSDGELSKRVITQARDTPQRAWLCEVSSVVLQQALADLNVAYRNFFTSVTGKRNGRKVAPSRLRSRKDNRQAIRFTKTPGSRSWTTAGCACRRSAMCPCAGPGCQPSPARSP